MRRMIMSILLSVVFLVSMSSVVFAEEGEKELEVKDFQIKDGWVLLKPFEKALSGHIQLMVENSSVFSSVPTFQPVGFMGLFPARNPAPAISRNLLVTRDFGVPVQTEPSIDVDPTNPDHVVLASIDYNFPYNSVYTSFDGGETWQGPNRVPLPEEASGGRGDPVVKFDRKGRAYQVFLSSKTKSYQVGKYYFDIPISQVAISSSEDGLRWEKAAIVDESIFEVIGAKKDKQGRLRATIVFTFLDKPWLAIGPDPLNPSNDAIYVSYTRFIYAYQLVYTEELLGLEEASIGTQIGIAASKNQGKNWLKKGFTELVYRFQEEEGEKKKREGEEEEVFKELKIRWVQGSQPAVAPDGTVYLVWYDSTSDGGFEGKGQIYLTSSKDGIKWSEPIVAAEFLEGQWKPHSANFRNPSMFPQIAIGPENEVYIAFAARTPGKPTDDGDIYFVRSLDGGKTFEKPKKINQDDTDRLQFFPAIAVDPQGTLHLMWGDMRDDPAGLKYHIYYTESKDRGENWGFDLPERAIHEPSTRVTDFPSNPNRAFPGGRFIGDYYSIAASEKDVYLVWTDSRLAEYGGINQKIGFARKRAMPSPEVFLNPAKGPGGQEVTLQAFNFQPDLNLFVKIGGQVVSAGRVNEEGRLTYRMFIPVAGEGAHDILVYDDSGNTAIGSFYMDFGFGDVQKELASLQKGESKQKQEPSERAPEDTLTTKDYILGGIIAVLLVIVGLLIRKRKKA